MATIIDLSSEPKFTIKTVAHQTGIRPVTLRAWERRHDILTPYRGDNRYRLYSERDVAILRWLKFRVDEGMSIRGAVNELRGMKNSNLWPEAIPLPPNPTQTLNGKTSMQYTTRLAHALLQHDEMRASTLLHEIQSSLDLMTVCMQIFVPAVRQIEAARYRDEITSAKEHFAMDYLRTRLLDLFQAYPSRHNAPLIFVGCAPMEMHELETLMLAVLLRCQGYRVEYLGPDVAIEDLVDYATYELPSLVILSAASGFSAREIRRAQSRLQQVRSGPTFAYFGQAFEAFQRLREEIPGNYLGETLQTVQDGVLTLLKARQKPSPRRGAAILHTACCQPA